VDRRGGGETLVTGDGARAGLEVGTTGGDSFRRLGGFGRLTGEGGEGRVLVGGTAGVGDALGVVLVAALPERL
jgi:hypothetical protein